MHTCVLFQVCFKYTALVYFRKNNHEIKSKIFIHCKLAFMICLFVPLLISLFNSISYISFLLSPTPLHPSLSFILTYYLPFQFEHVKIVPEKPIASDELQPNKYLGY
uniref:Uncharacterized protein n=1 Tax=Parascaris univalens TaxID=6257 RepID=A0A915C2P1_PARUN